MNIFYLDNDISKCAQMHVDKHVVKMIVEYAQLLSTAHRIIDGVESTGLTKTGRKQKIWTLSDARQDEIYKATHINHPSAKWARHSLENYKWLAALWLELMDEYTYRYGKHHSCERLIPHLKFAPKNIATDIPFCSPWRAMPEDYKAPKTKKDYCVESYRAYYVGAKSHMFKWKNRSTPNWINI